MQEIKDSFYTALRDRLAALDPPRTVMLGGELRPPVAVSENERPGNDPPGRVPPAVFLLRFGEFAPVEDFPSRLPALFKTACALTYWTEGDEALNFQDRGRALAALDAELFAITWPPETDLMDHALDPPVPLGRRIFWSRPRLAAAESDGRRLTRTATLDLFLFTAGAAA